MRAGFGKIELPVPAGVRLVGYANREGGAAGVHEPLHARALVLESGSTRVALCTVDLCWVSEGVVAAGRERIAALGAVPAEGVFVSATHTHSRPEDTDPACWPEGLDALIEQAVSQACERLEPAGVGVGWGMLHGHAVNRRRLEDPIDPAVFVIRIDAEDERPSRALEAELGDGAVAVFGQGACGDVNPLTPVVQDRLSQGKVVLSIAELRYYGPVEPQFPIGDRTGGSSAQATRMGSAVAQEVLLVRRGSIPQEVEKLWTRQLKLDGRADGPPWPPPAADHIARTYRLRRRSDDPLEVMLVGIDGPGIVLVGQPGETFVATGVDLRRALRDAGVAHPFVVGYANGYRSYLPPRHAFVDGGYEVGWAWWSHLSETLQDDIRERVLEVVQRHAHPDIEGVAS